MKISKQFSHFLVIEILFLSKIFNLTVLQNYFIFKNLSTILLNKYEAVHIEKVAFVVYSHLVKKYGKLNFLRQTFINK